MTDSTTETGDFDVTDFGAKDRDYLRAVDELEDATTTSIQDHAALSSNEVHYRHRKLGDMGLVAVGDVSGLSSSREARPVELTERGRELLASGVLEDVDEPNSNLKALQRQLNELRGRVDELEQQIPE